MTSVVIDDADASYVGIAAAKTYSPLVIDADTVLAFHGASPEYATLLPGYRPRPATVSGLKCYWHQARISPEMHRAEPFSFLLRSL